MTDLLEEELTYKKEYGLYWAGKSDCLKQVRTPARGQFVPLIDESINFAHSENLFIEGDNLEVLKLLKGSYLNKIKMIYIDPPYNTGKEFIYNDRFNGSHADWLNMIYPRLYLARELLSEDGVIFVSINDREVHHLRCVMDEIFAEENYVETFIWTRTSTPPSLSTKSRKTVEYILCYERKKDTRKYRGEPIDNGDAPLLNRGNPVGELIFPAQSIHFTIPDGEYKRGKYDRLELVTDLIVEGGQNRDSCILKGEFKWIQSKLNQELEQGTHFIVKSERFSIRFQRTVNDNYKAPNNFIDERYIDVELNRKIGIGTNETASQELHDLGLGNLFDYPKPCSLIKHLTRFKTDPEDIILDFFAGSASTAQAILELNREDGGNRKFICIQWGEPIDQRTRANQAGYNTIAELAKERIRRVIRGTDRYKGLGQGFKVYKLTDPD